ncbi:hypothetical protein ColTof4_13785 [Colletotrichum tofieldiae]|nr:hypothetical protein ColTof3_01761 [Colletotrichum tofieldiae]GKT81362.1 hypothetical protein ColTof4_13785 [Colletotrichum tofieldiae]
MTGNDRHVPDPWTRAPALANPSCRAVVPLFRPGADAQKDPPCRWDKGREAAPETGGEGKGEFRSVKPDETGTTTATTNKGQRAKACYDATDRMQGVRSGRVFFASGRGGFRETPGPFGSRNQVPGRTRPPEKANHGTKRKIADSPRAWPTCAERRPGIQGDV